MDTATFRKFIQNNSFAVRIILWFLSLTVIAFGSFFFITQTSVNSTIEETAYQELTALGQTKKQTVWEFFSTQLGIVDILSDTPCVKELFNTVKTKTYSYGSFDAYMQSGEFDQDTWALMPYLDGYKTKYGVEGVIMIDQSGEVMLSNSPDIPTGTDLYSEQYADSALKKALDDAIAYQSPHISDIGKLSARNEKLSLFTSDVLYLTAEDTVNGYIFLQLPVETLSNLIHENLDTDNSLNTYIVGSDLLLRTKADSTTDEQILVETVDTESVRRALQNQEGVMHSTGITGEQVLTYYSHLELPERLEVDFEWAIISEITESVAFAGLYELQETIAIFLLGGIIVTTLLAVLASRSLSNYIKKPIKNAADEMATASNQLSVSSQQLAAASQQNASIAQQISSGAQQQSAKISAVSESVAELIQAIKQVAVLAEDTASTAGQVSKLAESAGTAGEQSRSSLEQMKQLSAQTSQMVMSMAEVSKDIGSFVETITDISEQTNLLALNAAIEAARAGEAGRGFTVVADEVRNLAEDSAVAAGQVQEKIESMTNKINETVKSVEQSNEQTNQSSEVIQDTLNTLQQIATAIQEVSGKMQQVAASTQQQLSSSEKIGASTADIATIIEQNSSGVQELSSATQQQSSATQYIASAAQQILSLAENLRKIVGDSMETVANKSNKQPRKTNDHPETAPSRSPATADKPKEPDTVRPKPESSVSQTADSPQEAKTATQESRVGKQAPGSDTKETTYKKIK